MKLVYGKEGPLFGIVLVLSLIIWAALIIGTFGLALVYVLFFFIAYLFAHSAYISYIRGTGTQVTREQFPDLYGQLEGAGKKLEMREVPDTYVVNSNGVLNAMATRFLGHNLLVLNSDIVDALEERPAAISFYIGHELGHIRRNHLLMAPVVFFGMIFPLVGYAYSRAREYTCDLHGLACCADLEDAQRALAVLSVGHRRWKQLNLPAYAGQIRATDGFWMSFHELIGDYPWLVKRIEHITAVSQGRDYKTPRRHFFAWVIALFVPRLPVAGGSSGAGGLVFIAMIGILAAIAIPAYQDYIARSQASEAIQIAGALEKPLADFYHANQGWPNGLAASYPKSNVGKFTDHVELVGAAGQTIGVLATLKTANINLYLAGKTVELWTTDGGDTWHCGPGDTDPVDAKYLPMSCRDPGAP